MQPPERDDAADGLLAHDTVEPDAEPDGDPHVSDVLSSTIEVVLPMVTLPLVVPDQTYVGDHGRYHGHCGYVG